MQKQRLCLEKKYFRTEQNRCTRIPLFPIFADKVGKYNTKCSNCLIVFFISNTCWSCTHTCQRKVTQIVCDSIHVHNRLGMKRSFVTGVAFLYDASVQYTIWYCKISLLFIYGPQGSPKLNYSFPNLKYSVVLYRLRIWYRKFCTPPPWVM